MSLATVLPIALALAARPGGMSNGELAKEAHLTAAAASAYLRSYVQDGHVFKSSPEGRHPRYFHTAIAAEAFKQAHEKTVDEQPPGSHEDVARSAVARLRAHTLGTAALAQACRVSAQFLDAALAPLVDAGKLMRVNAFRNGAAEFDYRWSATWVPKPADFEVCRGGGVAPTAAISPIGTIAAPRPAPAGAVAAPVTNEASAAAPRDDRVKSGRTGGQQKAAKDSLDRAFAQPPQSLGWAPAPGDAKRDAAEAIEPASNPNPEPAKVDTRIGVEIKSVPLHIDVSDLVCALNSRGELALDVGDDVLVKFKPKHALALTRFLAGTTTVLEQMAQQGAL